MTSAIDAYQEFMALRHHFTTESYDYVKYSGKIKFPWRKIYNFETHRDYYQYLKLSKKLDLQNFILANILVKPKIWIRELVSSDECENIYKEWKRRKESFSYSFKQEISKLPDSLFNDIKRSGDLYLLVSFLLRQEISFETFYVLYMLLNIYNIPFVVDEPILNDIEFKLIKYKSFMERNFLIDEGKILNIAFEKFGRPAILKDEK